MATAHYQQKLTQHNNQLIRVVVGTNQGSPAWWCLLVDKLSWELYKKDIKQPTVDLSHYGKILKKGWGEWPPADVVAELKAAHGISLKESA